MRFHRCGASRAAHESARNGCKATARTTPILIAGNCEVEAFNRCSRGATQNMEVV